MELRSLILQPNLTHLFSIFTCCVKLKPSFQHLQEFSLKIGRRGFVTSQRFVRVRGMESSTEDTEAELSTSGDVHSIIQRKPGVERPQLRKLYYTLFNNVTKLDYAGRDKDGPPVWQCYENIVVAVNDILSRI